MYPNNETCCSINRSIEGSVFFNSLMDYLELSLPRYYNSTSNYITMLNSGASIIMNLLTHFYIVGTPRHQLYFELISVLNCGNY